jgi:hypothetical protein
VVPVDEEEPLARVYDGALTDCTDLLAGLSRYSGAERFVLCAIFLWRKFFGASRGARL